MNKKISIIILCILLIAGIATYICLEKYMSVIPTMYVNVQGGEKIKGIKGGFEWNTLGKSVIADAAAPIDFEYSAENEIEIELGEELIVTNSRNYSSHIYSATIYDFESKERISEEKMITKSIIETIQTPGTYILDIVMQYENKGRVEYGVKVIIKNEVKRFEKYDGTFIGDNVQVNEIIEQLPYAKNKKEIVLHTAKEPYGLTIKYVGDNIKREDLLLNTMTLFSLIPNLEYIEYEINGVETFTEKRDVYGYYTNLTYQGLKNYCILNDEEVAEIWNKYLAVFTNISKNDLENESKDEKLLLNLTAIYYINEKNPAIDGNYPYKVLNDIYHEVFKSGKDLEKRSYGSFVYIKEKDIYQIATEYSGANLLDIEYAKKNDGIYEIRYTYCYPSESEIMNLPTVKVDEHTETIDEETYKQYIDNLTKYTNVMKIQKNDEYVYSKYHIVSY